MLNNRRLVAGRAKKLMPVLGINDKILSQAVLDSGLSIVYKDILFPGGIKDLLCFVASEMDEMMLHSLAQTDLTQMRIRDRVKHAVMIRLSLYSDIDGYREFLQKLVWFCLRPQNVAFSTKIAYDTSGKIWCAIGDNSVDFNFYTKRLLLSSVYIATFIHFAKDDSEEHCASQVFLENKIDSVLKIGKFFSRF